MLLALYAFIIPSFLMCLHDHMLSCLCAIHASILLPLFGFTFIFFIIVCMFIDPYEPYMLVCLYARMLFMALHVYIYTCFYVCMSILLPKVFLEVLLPSGRGVIVYILPLPYLALAGLVI